MNFTNQELRKIIQSKISDEMKIALLQQLHSSDMRDQLQKVRVIYSGAQDAIEDGIVGLASKNSLSISSNMKVADPFLIDALNLLKHNELSVMQVQRHFKIGYNRASDLLSQCNHILSEENA